MKTKAEILRKCLDAEHIHNQKIRYAVYDAMEEYANQCQEDMAEEKYTESQLRDAIRNTITYLAKLSETGKFHSGNIIEEAIINSLNKQE